jgi:hypothetical protein
MAAKRATPLILMRATLGPIFVLFVILELSS